MTNYSERASRIVDRVMPRIATPHGFYDPQGFAFVAWLNAARGRLYWRTFARLRAKAEGGPAFITVPKGCAHLYGPGNAMFDVARELAAQA